ncbi:MAG: translation elongation factor Ts [Tenericutes bacterium HGW-Tenericutes-7]|nr:MAG: translation elongation factor Ts [Tenericutes bacterium HGW-Tenericutes-7]
MINMRCIMDITLIKKLREETGSGIVETKKALELHHGDYESAKAHLLKNLKKETGNLRVASKGLTHLVIKENEAILYEVNAETDFVNKNEHFNKMIKDIGDALITSKASHVKEALKVKLGDQTIEEKILHTSAIIKENAYLRRFYRILKHDSQAFGFYQHLQGKISTLVILDKDLGDFNNKLAMHIAASEPKYLSFSQIDTHTMDYETFMYEKNHGQVSVHDFNKYLESVTLDTQYHVLDPSVRIGEIIHQNHAKVIDFFRFEVGQGIDNKLNCRLDIPCDGSKITVTPIY